METYTWLDLGVYLLIYSFLGWLAEAGYYAVTRRRFCNRGFFTQPLLLSWGISFDLMLVTLPTLGDWRVLQFIAVLVITSVVETISGRLMMRLGFRLHWNAERVRLYTGTGKGVLASLLVAGVCYLVYLVLQPLFMGLLLLIPTLVEKITLLVIFGLLLLDFAAMLLALWKGSGEGYRLREERGRQRKLAGRLSAAIWRRLSRAYPGIQETQPQERRSYTFAKGLCFDKIIWVFLVSALLGDLIETLYCGLVDGKWMSRSSVLYGPFSFVWGLGAVVLSVTLQRLADKADRYVFLAGFVIGGSYEYLCSVFTELLFGTVFWDYSEMPLNIGGRTNVLFCCFWGMLAVLWIKRIYPLLSAGIEKLPVVLGKVFTWIIIFFMVCNAFLTCVAMLRYEVRQDNPQPTNAFESFLDRQYGDEFMENRWPNMRVAE